MPRKSPGNAKARPTSVADVVAGLPESRRREFERVLQVVRKHLPAGYEETVSSGMIVYQVPFDRYSDTYNGQPLWYAALAAPKTSLTLHLMSLYASPELQARLQEGFRASGRKLDMGKACIHFQRAEDLDLDTVAEIVGAVPLKRWIEIAKAARRR
jgi:hypothetical protein